MAAAWHDDTLLLTVLVQEEEPNDDAFLAQAGRVAKGPAAALLRDAGFRAAVGPHADDAFFGTWFKGDGVTKMDAKLGSKDKAKAKAEDNGGLALVSKLAHSIAVLMRHSAFELRAATVPASRAALDAILRPQVPKLRCGRYFPNWGWALLRGTLDLDNFQRGLADLGVGGVEGAVQVQLDTMLQQLSGQGLPTWRKALSGRLCAGTDMDARARAMEAKQQQAIPPWLLVLGLRSAADADALLAGVKQVVSALPNLGVDGLELPGERPGMRLTMGPFSVSVLRHGDALILASETELLQRSLARKADNSVGKTAFGAHLDGGSPWLVGLQIPALQRLSASFFSLRPLASLVASSGSKEGWLALEMTYDRSSLGLSLGVVGEMKGSFATRLLAVTVGVGVPQFVRYMRRAKAAEARELSLMIAQSAARFAGTARKDGKTGATLLCRFPTTTTLTPGKGACCSESADKDDDDRCDADAAPWQQRGWRELEFAISDQHYYRYRFVSEGVGSKARFRVEATGDLDCDGNASRFTIEGQVSADRGDGTCEVSLGKLKVEAEEE